MSDMPKENMEKQQRTELKKELKKVEAEVKQLKLQLVRLKCLVQTSNIPATVADWDVEGKKEQEIVDMMHEASLEDLLKPPPEGPN